MRAYRRRDALEGDALHHHADRGAGHSFGRHLRIHAVLERIHLCAGFSVVGGAEDGFGRDPLGPDRWRRILLGAADGRRAARLRSGSVHLFILRRVLRRGPDRIGQGLNRWHASSSAISTKSTTRVTPSTASTWKSLHATS